MNLYLSLPFVCLAFGVLEASEPSSFRVLPESFSRGQQPQISAGTDGIVHLVFGMDGAVYYSQSGDLKQFTPPFKVATLPKLALGMRRGPRIAASSKTLIVTAQSHEDGNLHAWHSADNGKSWQELPQLNGRSSSAKEGLHALASDGRQTVAAAWLDARSGGGEVWSRVSTDGGSTWHPETLVYRSPEGKVCECCAPAVAVSSEGKIALMWRNSLSGARDMYLSLSMDAGRTFRTAAKLGRGTWNLNACPMDGGAVAWGHDGFPKTVWRRETSVFLSDAENQENLLSGNALQPLVAQSSKGTVMLWEQKGDLIIQHSSGSPSVFQHKGRAASLAALPSGQFAAAWETLDQPAQGIRFTLIEP